MAVESNKQVTRVLELVKRHVLEGKPLPSAEEIATEFRISKRTAFRDLAIVQELRFRRSSLTAG